MNPLFQLLAAATGQMSPETVQAEKELTVTAKKPRSEMSGMGMLPRGDVNVAAPDIKADPINLRNDKYIQADIDRKKKAPQHEGIFGVKGTLRDVLGALGDSYLATQGRGPVFAPLKEKEKIGDAAAGFTEKPQQALERLFAGGNIQEGNALLNGYNQNESRKQGQQSTDAYRDALTKDRQLRQIGVVRDRAARVLSQVKKPEQFRDALGLITKWLPEGALLEDLGIDELMTPGQQALYAGSDMTVNQQQNLPLAERRTAVAEQNADANTTRANRPPAGRAAPQPTNASIVAPLLEKVKRGEPLTKGQQEALTRTGYSVNRGKGRTIAVPPVPPGLFGK